MCLHIGYRTEHHLKEEIYPITQLILKRIGMDTRDSRDILHQMPVKLLQAYLRRSRATDSTHRREVTTTYVIDRRLDRREVLSIALANSAMPLVARKGEVQATAQLEIGSTVHQVG